MEQPQVTVEAIRRAWRRVGGYLQRTPLLSSATLSREFGIELRLKAELFQKTGSFKPRGLLHRVLTLAPADRARGLVSISAGNAAAAIAWAARTVGTRAVLVMPAKAMESKIEATEGYGGEVILTEGNLLDACHEVREERGLTFVHPFDDLEVMTGHGTLGLEIAEEWPGVEAVLVPVGGGGLIGGVAAALKATRPATEVIGVEPAGAAAMTRSLEQGSPVHLDRLETVADGLAAPFAGAHTLDHVRRFVDRIVIVDDDAILEALRRVQSRAKLAAEPSGAACLAPLIAGSARLPRGARVVGVISGGNVDRALLERTWRSRSQPSMS